MKKNIFKMYRNKAGVSGTVYTVVIYIYDLTNVI